MNALDLARWQFGIVTVYHFLFVPLTIGLSFLVALMQTAWYRSGNAKYLAMTKFWGKLFLINFAMGVVTGIVQEFQFGMNWSDYSRFVGDVFGAPLAIEAMIAFFLEATFIGLWIFGWDRLPRLPHTGTRRCSANNEAPATISVSCHRPRCSARRCRRSRPTAARRIHGGRRADHVRLPSVRPTLAGTRCTDGTTPTGRR